MNEAEAMFIVLMAALKKYGPFVLAEEELLSTQGGVQMIRDEQSDSYVYRWIEVDDEEVEGEEADADSLYSDPRARD